MHVITKKRLQEAQAKFPDAANELAAWLKVVRSAVWWKFPELKQAFPDADVVDEYVVFNIRHNHYRLITIVRYSKVKPDRITQGRIYIQSFLTHKQYDNRKNWSKGVIG
jgi:mRNA interferase HigB